ncbi:hypothetical protein NKDENANG_03737 [Candidatus Entotheonellaceae bacterium PAL068K]
MKFFFPDSQDMIDPTFDFQTEKRAEWRIRQRDDLYPHEVYRTPPYDGILVSMAPLRGSHAYGGKSRYSLAQRGRLWRQGVQGFFRTPSSLEIMGDPGAFSYIREDYPPVAPDDVIDFYEQCNFDYGLSVDHVILGFQASLSSSSSDDVPPEWLRRQEITLALADEFVRRCHRRKVHFTPLGVAQGWSPTSYAQAVEKLQKMGYRRVALGGMVALPTDAILHCLEETQAIRRSGVALHLLGVTRCEHIGAFQKYGVTSFDSTSPLRQAWMDAKHNYYTMERTYLALRVPQSEGNPQLQARIRSGELHQETVRRLEDRCLQVLIQYDQGKVSVETALEHVLAYERIHHPKEDRSRLYAEVLEDRPWANCSCVVCRQLGIHIMMFRGAERNKRRGFHNVSVFYARLQRELATTRQQQHR